MKILKTKDYERMTEKTIEVFIDILEKNKHKERINVSVTGGNSPKLFYAKIVSILNELTYLDKIHFYNFDEVPFRNDLSTGITSKDLEELLFSKAKIKQENIHRLNVLNYKEHMDKLYKDGGLDLVLLGIGIDGHFCGNMSGVTKFGDKTRLINNSDLEGNISVPKLDMNLFHDQFVTMGPRDIMAARNIIMIANGKGKAEVIDQIVNGPVIEKVPSTILTLHPFFTLILDEEANSIAKA
ncbi:glucosamine-6-phosphate deaminase [Mesoplasma coleopterae]|uniref:Glucosamine-6-phosphate deaminase n=1 Tax=Mesoplasma coleopterae TaxID=324078 RepID=A0A2K8P4M9_9MOLU|nr:glucosamine-6-phosphate deaminase [Mesoplasma coleopterae]ATZ20555.1 glucosamine-6-phosphate deaminase [Mesoplasma coleopterae]